MTAGTGDRDGVVPKYLALTERARRGAQRLRHVPHCVAHPYRCREINLGLEIFDRTLARAVH